MFWTSLAGPVGLKQLDIVACMLPCRVLATVQWLEEPWWNSADSLCPQWAASWGVSTMRVQVVLRDLRGMSCMIGEAVAEGLRALEPAHHDTKRGFRAANKALHLVLDLTKMRVPSTTPHHHAASHSLTTEPRPVQCLASAW